MTSIFCTFLGADLNGYSPSSDNTASAGEPPNKRARNGTEVDPASVTKIEAPGIPSLDPFAPLSADPPPPAGPEGECPWATCPAVPKTRISTPPLHEAEGVFPSSRVSKPSTVQGFTSSTLSRTTCPELQTYATLTLLMPACKVYNP